MPFTIFQTGYIPSLAKRTKEIFSNFSRIIYLNVLHIVLSLETEFTCAIKGILRTECRDIGRKIA